MSEEGATLGASARPSGGRGASSGQIEPPSAPIVSPARAAAEFARAIRLQCIRRRDPTIAELAVQSGVPEARIRKFLRDDMDARAPRPYELLSIWAVLGANAATFSLALIGMHVEDDDGAEEALAQSVADMLGEVGALAQCAAAGGIGPRNAAQVEHAADQIIEEARGVRRRARAGRKA